MGRWEKLKDKEKGGSPSLKKGEASKPKLEEKLLKRKNEASTFSDKTEKKHKLENDASTSEKITDEEEALKRKNDASTFSDKTEKKNKQQNVASTSEKIAGLIFMCNARTKPECYRYRVFGLPSNKEQLVRNIKHGAKLFLYDFELRLLYGIYEASSDGGMKLEPDAFGGRYPAQVKFKVQKDCLPLRESTFRDAIKDNYFEQFRFNPELNAQQVENLCKLFQPVGIQRRTSPSVSAANPGAMSRSSRGHRNAGPVLSAVSAPNHREERRPVQLMPEIAPPKDREYPVDSRKLHGRLLEQRSPPRRMAYPVEGRQGIRSRLSFPAPERDEHHLVLEDRKHDAGLPALEVVHPGHVPFRGRDHQVLHDVPLYERAYQVRRGHVPIHEREYEVYRDRVPVHEREYREALDIVPLHEREYQMRSDHVPLHEREHQVHHDRIPLREREYEEPRVGRELGDVLYSSRLQVDELGPVLHENPLYHRATTYGESSARQQVAYERPSYGGGAYVEATRVYGDPTSEMANMPVSSRYSFAGAVPTYR